ncbi:MAG TPA: GntR family transcriptional regulator [Firmicutes bacterium]|nr:GntR family transcriptional regulator [Bacillota bacterium]
MPIYHSIATDLAQRIVNEEFITGERISGRTLLSSHYHVSPETIRKAIGLLKDAKIVDVSQGREITVVSPELARHFVEKAQYMHSVYSLKQDLEQLLQEKQEIDKKLETILTDIINFSDRLKNLSPYNPIEIKVPPSSKVLGKTIADLHLWQATGATLVAIRRGNQVTVSPGPHVILQANDRVVIVGNENVLKKTVKMLQETT